MHNNYHVNLAISQALKSQHIEFKHGAILTKGKKVLCQGFNTEIRNNGHHNIKYRSIHAEMHLFLNMPKKLKDSLSKNKNLCVYVVRVSPGGRLRLSKPCPHCMALLKKYNVYKVYYSTDSEIECIYI